MALGTDVWAAEPASGGQPAERGWLWASGRIQLREHRFPVLLYKPRSPHGEGGTDPEGPLSQPLDSSGGHCTLGVLEGNSFLQATKPNHPSPLAEKPAWTHSAQAGSYVLTPTCRFLCLESNLHPGFPEAGYTKCFQTVIPLVCFSH